MMTTLPVIDADYLRALKKTTADKEAEARASLRPHEPYDTVKQVPLDQVSKRSRIGQLGKLAAEHGWTVKIGEAKYYSGDTYVKSSGEVKHGKDEVWTWLQAIKDGHRILYSTNTCMIDGKVGEQMEDGKTKPYAFNDMKVAVESL